VTQYEIGGLLRCCAEAVPDRDGSYDGEHHPCKYHGRLGESDYASGVKWDACKKCWVAAWAWDKEHEASRI
jgi:hypothetical protein